MKIIKATCAFTALLSLAPFALAQSSDKAPEKVPQKYDKSIDCKTLPTRTAAIDCAYENSELHIFRLENVTQQNDANEILVAIRNLVEPSTKLFLIANQGAIVTDTYPANITRIAEIISGLDRPHKSYRVTYTFTDSDTGKVFPLASTVMSAGQNSVMKRGSKIPVITSEVAQDSSSPRAQYTFLDVGLLIDTTVAESTIHGASVKFKVEQSALAENTGKAAPNDPILNQTTLTGTVQLTTGKTETIGAVELPNSKDRITINALLEEVQ